MWVNHPGRFPEKAWGARTDDKKFGGIANYADKGLYEDGEPAVILPQA
jgi:hypothetical protein